MTEQNIKELYKIPTTIVGALPINNYFDVVNGYKKELKKWALSFQPEFDFDKALEASDGEQIEIPYMGELHGLCSPVYSNDRYLFPYLPPYILKRTSAQIYVRKENIELDDKDYILQLEGVDNAYYLFVNKQFVGFGNISHGIVRFDITNKLVNGENEIRIVVLKFTPSSYLEDQDKIRFSGIFRRVYLIKREKDRLNNFKITTDVKGTTGVIQIKADKTAKYILKINGQDVIKEGLEATFEVENAKLWNSEEPNLYDLYLEYNNETIHQYVGIRKIEIKGNLFYINGKVIKMKGTNRHSSTLNAYCETHELMEKDIELCRKFNINAIRTSHYPADPYFYELCDKNGIYLISETDLETHGEVRRDGGYDTITWGKLIDMPEFYEQILERQMNNVISNMNHPSVIIWSLGNESGWGEVIEKLCKEIKKIDDRPIHYEGSFDHANRTGYHDAPYLDVYSRMYASIDYCRDEAPKLEKPFMQCEYAHAMGTSLGELGDYMKAFWNNESFFGAFIWEWTNHYVLEDNIEKYGGDFGEEFNDGTFCCDGVVNLDRSLTPQIYELRESYAPIQYIQKEDGVYVLNRLDFISLKDYKFIVHTLKNGVVISTKEMVLDVNSKEQTKLIDNLPKDNNFNSYTIGLVNPRGEVISEQSIVNEPIQKMELVSNNKITYELDRDGLISEVLVNGKPTLKNMIFQLDRPYLSNDIKFIDKLNYLRIKNTKFYAVSHEQIDGGIKVIGYLAVDAYSPFYKVEISYFDNFKIAIHATKVMEFDSPLRFGIRFELPEGYEEIEYLGLKGESYCDRYGGNPFGLFDIKVEDNYRDIYPQQSNDHFNTQYICLPKEKVYISADKTFSFNYDCFANKDYLKHRNEMSLTKKRYLSLDYKMFGVGTMACGPELQDKYRIKEDTIDIVFQIA